MNMKIIWNNISEVKDFIDLVGLSKLCKNEKEWGGVGFIITGKDVKKDWETPTQESYTLRGSDLIVVTPYYKELSWLFRITHDYPTYGKLTSTDYLEGFWYACTGFFLKYAQKPYKAKELVSFVIDFLAGVEKRKAEKECEAERRETKCQKTGR